MASIAGNAIQLTVNFFDLDGNNTEVTTPVTKVYNYETQIGSDINITNYRQGPGLYIFKYQIPVGLEGELSFLSTGKDLDDFDVISALEIQVTTEQYNAMMTRNSDKIRFLIQDTDESDLMLQNSEINAMYEMCGNSVYATAIGLCDVLAARLTKLISKKKLGDLEITYIKKAEEYMLLKKMLKQQITLKSIPCVGGLSNSDLLSDKEDTDIIRPKFSKDMHEDHRMGTNYSNYE